MRKRDWFVVAALAAAAVLWFAFRFEAEAALIVARGANGGCSWREVSDGFRRGRDEATLAARYARESKLLGEDNQGLTHWRTPKGDYWVVSSDAEVVTHMIAEQERGVYSAGGSGVKPGDILLDCGANIGVYSRTALEGGAAKVIAIEPEPKTLECLRRNLAKQASEGRVVIVGKGVWDKEEFLQMQVHSTNPSASTFLFNRDGGQHNAPLPLTTIDKLVAELGLERVDFIKMDIEGAERNAVAGAQETIRRFHPRMALSVYHLPDDPEVIDQKVMGVWPGYKRISGPCTGGRDRAGPEVYFYE